MKDKIFDFIMNLIISISKNVCWFFSTRIVSYFYFVLSLIFSLIFVILISFIRLILMFIISIITNTNILYVRLKNIIKNIFTTSNKEVREKFNQEYEFFNKIQNNDIDVKETMDQINEFIKENYEKNKNENGGERVR